MVQFTKASDLFEGYLVVIQLLPGENGSVLPTKLSYILMPKGKQLTTIGGKNSSKNGTA